MRRTLAVVAVFLTACGGGRGAAAPATTAQPTTTITTATVGQIASIVAKQNADLRRYAASAKACEIVESPRCDFAARLGVTTLTITAATLDVTLRAAAEDRPNNTLFIGAYPAELVRLVAATRSAIAEVTAAGEALKACSGTTVGPACAAPYLLMGSAAGHLVQQLDAWAPYL